MDYSPRLALRYIQPQQAQKHVTVNESMRRLDALAQAAVLSRSVAAEPTAPAEGDAHILPAGASGAAWSGFAAGSIAAFQDGAWSEIAPAPGFLAYVADEDSYCRFADNAWAPLLSAAAMVGVNAAPSLTTRLAVRSDAVSFAFDVATPGAGDVTVKLDKAAAARTAALQFRDAASSRAECGLLGDDDFRVRVSADGAAWANAIIVDRANGNVGVGAKSAGGRFEAINSAASYLSYSAAGQLTLRHDGGTRPRINIIDSGGYGEGYIDFYTYPGQGVPTCRWQGIDTGDYAGAHVFFTAVGGAANSALAERLRIAANGNVGIGMAAPACKLDVDGPVRVKSYGKSGLPSAAPAGQMAYVSDEAGGAIIAFSDGSAWRRLSDRAVVS